MMLSRFGGCVAIGLLTLALQFSASTVVAQQTTIGVPQQIVSDSFYERFGIHWGFRQRWAGGGGIFFDNGGFGGVAPAFGGFDPNAGARFGFGATGNQGGLFFGFAADQGSNRSMTTTAPMITLPNGGFGSIQSGSIQPFVTGIVPVVGEGGGGVRTHPLAERLQRRQSGERPGVRSESTSAAPPPESVADDRPTSNDATGPPAATSTAQRGDLSVKEIRRQQSEQQRIEAAETQAKLADLIAQGEAAEAKGRPGAARSYYLQAHRLAAGETASDLAARIRRLAR